MALETVQDYITAAQTILQDEGVVRRYTNAELSEALGFGLMEARRIRPELFIFNAGGLPDIKRTTPVSTAIDLDPMYRYPFILFMVHWTMSRDEEEGSQVLANS